VKTVISWPCYFIFFPPQISRRLWADFCETLPHYTMCPKIFYLLFGRSYMPPKNLRSEKPQFSPIYRPKIDTGPQHSIMRGKSGNLKQWGQSVARRGRPDWLCLVTLVMMLMMMMVTMVMGDGVTKKLRADDCHKDFWLLFFFLVIPPVIMSYLEKGTFLKVSC